MRTGTQKDVKLRKRELTHGRASPYVEEDPAGHAERTMKVLVIQSWKEDDARPHPCEVLRWLSTETHHEISEVTLDGFSVEALSDIGAVLVDAQVAAVIPRLKELLGAEVSVVLMAERLKASDVPKGKRLGADYVVTRREIAGVLEELEAEGEPDWWSPDSAPFLRNIDEKTRLLEKMTRQLQMYLVVDEPS